MALLPNTAPTNAQLQRGFQAPVTAPATPMVKPPPPPGSDIDRYSNDLKASSTAPLPTATTATPIINPAGARHSGQRDTSSPTLDKNWQDEKAASKIADADSISMLPIELDKPATTKTTPTGSGGTTSSTSKTTSKAATGGATGSTTPPKVTAGTKKYDLEADNTKSEKMLDDLMASQKNLTNTYMDKLNTMEFAYNAEDDPDYKQAANQMETRLMTSMTGRGALYSSVAQAAYQAKLIELESSFRQGAYQEFVNDRAFTQSMAQMVYNQQNADFTKGMQLVTYQTGREDAAWTQKIQVANFEAQRAAEAFTQKMQVAQYNAQRQDAAWQKSLQQQQLNISRANAAASRAAAAAQTKLAGVRATIETNVAKVQVEQTKFSKAVSAWQNSNTGASKEVVAYFASQGISMAEGTGYSSKVGQTVRTKVDTTIQNSISYIQQQATEYKQADILQASANDFTLGKPDTSFSDNAYSSQLASMKLSVVDAASALANLNEIKNNAPAYRAQLGPTGYANLVGEARDLYNKYDEMAVR